MFRPFYFDYHSLRISKVLKLMLKKKFMRQSIIELLIFSIHHTVFVFTRFFYVLSHNIVNSFIIEKERLRKIHDQSINGMK